MEILEKIGEGFNSVTGSFERFLTKVFGSSNERTIKKIGYYRDKDGTSHVVPGSVLERINSLESEFEKQTDDELRQSAARFRERIAKGETLDSLLPEAFAAVRECSKRVLKMRHYNVQMVGGYILHQGNIAEMVTGEGKTLVGTLPTFLNALAGSVHVVTVNDYLALRDMEWMGPVYTNLGLTVGAIQGDMRPDERQVQYACDITYGTNNEFGFDYLRDNMKPTKELQVQGSLDFAVIDEIDNILIDEARTPLIISGPAEDDPAKYAKANRIALQLKRGVDFEVKEKEHHCHLTEEGIRHAEELAGVESFYTVGNMEWPHLIDNALKAHHLYKRDFRYMVKDGEVIIVDEFTGRAMPGRQWSDGLHQAVEAKEGVRIKEETQTLATITLQNYFKLYDKLCGMTGTAMTEASEFWKIYQLDVIAIPTNKPMARINNPDKVFITEKEKWDAVVEEIREQHETGRPILVGTVSIETSELLSSLLKKYGIKHNVLNAKHAEKEAELIAQAGRKGAVTIATNMAGRGTDIILGGNPENHAWEILHKKYTSRLDVPKAEWDALTKKVAEEEGMEQEGREVAELGGLHVVGTERHDSRRIDLQLRGRSGRQGDPGSSRFFVSMDDELMRLFAGEKVKSWLRTFGLGEGEAIESRMVTKRIEAAQKKREETHFDQRKNLLEYDEVMEEQRNRVYQYRQEILDGVNNRGKIQNMIEQQIEEGVSVFWDPMYAWEAITSWVLGEFHLLIDSADIRGMEKEHLIDYLKDEAINQADQLIYENLEENLPEDEEDTSRWNWKAFAHWFNKHFEQNVSVAELKKIGREHIQEDLRERAFQSVERYQYDRLDGFLDPDYPLESMCFWLQTQFTLESVPSDYQRHEEVETLIEEVKEKVFDLYRQKEVQFPVIVGMSRFLQPSSPSQKPDREQLIDWVNHRFHSSLSIEDIRHIPQREIASLLTSESQKFFVNGEVTSQVEDYLDQAYENANGHPISSDDPQASAALGQLARWVNEELRAEVEPNDFEDLTREGARQRVLEEYDRRFRPELSKAEREVILTILDTSWKDHLYYMDHLKSGIGLVGYAQRDAKVEYKKEGSKAFEAMWARMGQQVTQTLFRIEQEAPEFVSNLWNITGTIKDAPPPTNVPEEYQSQPGDDINVDVVDPIRNSSPKVGRNDPCPCGSGKKYKKCCG